jgi:hypothetical protein
MVSPYQVWVLGRLSDVMATAFEDEAQSSLLRTMLAGFDGGPEILDLPKRLKGCRLRKQFEQLFVNQ